MNTSDSRPVPFEFEPSASESFKVLLDEGPYFFAPYHFHRECQLTLVLESTGTRFIGESVARFSADDVVLIGSNLPHVFRNDPHYYEEGANLTARAISIFFTPDFLGESFWAHSELHSLSKWIAGSNRGLVFYGETRRRAGQEIRRILDMEPGFPRLMALLDLLYRLFRSGESQFLSDQVLPQEIRLSDTHKLHRVFEHIMNHYREDVRLEDVASLASMTPSAFSRYFKRQTRKTLTEFVLDIRIAEACKRLLEEDTPVGEIAFGSGFHNLSNFNRRFKERKQMTPRAYRERGKMAKR